MTLPNYDAWLEPPDVHDCDDGDDCRCQECDEERRFDALSERADSIDAVVTDPPYGLGFMGKAWDDLPPGLPWARECLRVLKPGGHLLAFGGTRTSHRLTCAVEDAGFEIRDSIAWLYGSGFPKSLDVSKAIDSAAGVERTVERTVAWGTATGTFAPGTKQIRSQTGVTADAVTWQGCAPALKPAFEPIVVARKPLIGTVAGNVMQHGTGGLNIDGCRVGDISTVRVKAGGAGDFPHEDDAWVPKSLTVGSDHGRWPANVVLDGSQADALDAQAGVRTSGAFSGFRNGDKFRDTYGEFGGTKAESDGHEGSTGGASRFFPTFRYEAKAPTLERPRIDGLAHATVKPLELMRWLVRLVTPRGGTVLEPFAGSGTTAEACVIEGFKCVAIEREADYLPLIVQRVRKPLQPVLDFETPA